MPTTYAIPNGRTVMDATLFTSTGSAQTITNQYGFKPDFIWQKARSQAYANGLVDSVRGANQILYSNLTNTEATATNAVNSFNSNGYTGGGDAIATNGNTVVAWQWNAGSGSNTTNTSGTITSTVSANTTAGFSIVTYTGNGVQSATVGHGLGATPSLIFIKRRDTTAQDWGVYNVSGGLKLLQLNTASSYWNSASNYWYALPTSSVFSPDNSFTDHYQNVNGAQYVAYCWAPVAGYSAFGSYTGNGSSDGPFIYTGFRPKLIIFKNATASADWDMIDTSRNQYNVMNYELYPDLSNAESSGSNVADCLSNGFKIRGTAANFNQSSQTIIYAAFAENPFKYANAR